MLLPKRKPNFDLMRNSLLKVHQFNWQAMQKRLTDKQESTKLTSISLDDKVDEFLKWHTASMTDSFFVGDDAIRRLVEMRNFIEKMAAWYELRYPDYELNRLIPWTTQTDEDIDDVMFNNNSYINTSLDEDNDIRVLDWDMFYNAEVFINSLPYKEKCIFNEPRYSCLVYIDINRSGAHLHLTPDGFVEESEGLGVYSDYLINDQSLKGMHIKQVVQLLKSQGIKLPSDNELEATIKEVDNQLYQREEVLNCVMYRLIERGGNIIGPRRAFLFAKEFGRNIGIPMMYGVSYIDEGLRLFINEYIKAGGSSDLECYVGYFSRATKNAKLDTISVQSLLQFINHSLEERYTPEENELHQRMVNTLAKQIDSDKLRKEEIRELRLQRKLQKARKKL